MPISIPQSLVYQSEAECASESFLDSRTRDLLIKAKSLSIEEQSRTYAPPSLQVEEFSHYLRNASNLKELGHFHTAELLLIAILNWCPSSEEAMLRLAELYEQLDSYSKTLKAAKALISSSDGADNAEAHYQYAFALFKLGRQDEALEAILPQYISANTPRTTRLCGLILKSLGELPNAIEVFEDAINRSPRDVHSIRALSEIYAEIGMFQKSLDLLRTIPDDLADQGDHLGESLMLRFMGELDNAIKVNSDIIAQDPNFSNALWTQCFNFSTAGYKHAHELLDLSKKFWLIKKSEDLVIPNIEISNKICTDGRLRVAFLSSDIGDHVVSRFMNPLLRHYDKSRYHISLLSTYRRFEEKASEIAGQVDLALSLQEHSGTNIYELINQIKPDIIIETNGFTRHSGIGILSNRCAPVQCHYIGYHATTGLDTIDFFIGDSITTPSDFQEQYTEKLAQIPSLWMAYDSTIEFPPALSTAKRDCLVLGSFSQSAKINRQTLEYWAEAMKKSPESILVIKDRGMHCDSTRKRIEETLYSLGINPSRIYMFGAVASHLDHLDAYNAIDVALDTTPWSSATTAFEALGMGVPLIAICGDTTSGRMSTSVVSAAGMTNLVAHSKEEFAAIVAELAKDYKQIRSNKSTMQKRVRSGILFDEQRICRDFFETIDRLVADHLDCSEAEHLPLKAS